MSAQVPWDAVAAIATALAAVSAATAAGLSYLQLRAYRKVAQVQAFADIFGKVRNQEQAFYGSPPKSADEKALRDRMFFNTVEFVAFLVNRDVLKERQFKDYYREAFLYWEEVFEREVLQQDRDDPRNYPEFKKLVADLKGRKAKH